MITTTPSKLAQELNTDQRTLRKFLRNTTPKSEHPGSGHRWVLPGGKRDVNRLKKQFEQWRGEHTRAA